MALGALGSDTGGSVREPAGFCGVVGLKPTYGSVSRYGLMAMGSSLDVIGPLSKTVTDSEIIFDAIKGKDKMDSTSIEAKMERSKDGNIKIGVPYHLLDLEGVSSEVKDSFGKAVKKLEGLGYEIVDIKLPNIDKALAVYYIIMPAEVSSNMARYDGIKYGLSAKGDNLLEVYKKSRAQGFGPEVRRRMILGTYVLSSGYYEAYYGKAMAARQAIRRELSQAFEKVDAILTPTAPFAAWKRGEKTSPLENYLADIFTVTANIAGIPAISLPGETSGMPIGIQLMAPHFGEKTLFSIGKSFLGEKE
jgi:aspartyl-tRNA(Asn)/glutamyl-tRNA(Gln) amidotransferase subunit A